MQDATGGDAGDITDTTTQTASASADGGSNTNGSFTATQNANPTTTTTSSTTQSGSTGRGGDTVGANKQPGTRSPVERDRRGRRRRDRERDGQRQRRRWERHRRCADANGGFAKSGDAHVVNIASVKQESDQDMKVWDNDKWLSFTIELKKKRHSW